MKSDLENVCLSVVTNSIISTCYNCTRYEVNKLEGVLSWGTCSKLLVLSKCEEVVVTLQACEQTCEMIQRESMWWNEDVTVYKFLQRQHEISVSP